MLEQRIKEKLSQQSEQGLLRTRQVHPHHLVNFAANDYLGIAESAEFKSELLHLIKTCSCGSGASPLVTGYSQAHQALEQALCQQTGHQAALLFSSGFCANQALNSTLFQTGDAVLVDKLAHASIIDGLQAKDVKFRRFLHNDLASAKRLSQKISPLAIVTESVFSMDGDCAPLEQLKALAQSNQAWLVVDDAHGFAVPKGSFPDVSAQLANVQLITFGKALGCQGAALLGSQAFVNFMVAQCRHYIYSTALSPLSAAIALAALTYSNNTALRQKLAANIQFFKELAKQNALAITESDTAIQPLFLSSNEQTLSVAQKLKQQGIIVGAIRPPTVVRPRLRITLSAAHTKDEISQLVIKLAEVLKDSQYV